MGKFFSLVWVKRTVRTVLVTASSFFLVFVVNGSVNASAKDLSGSWEFQVTYDPEGDGPGDGPPNIYTVYEPRFWVFADGTITAPQSELVGIGAYTFVSGTQRNPTVEDVWEFVYFIDFPADQAGILGCPGGVNEPSCVRSRSYYLVTLSADGDSFTARGCADFWAVDSAVNPNRNPPEVYCEERPDEAGQVFEWTVVDGVFRVTRLTFAFDTLSNNGDASLMAVGTRITTN